MNLAISIVKVIHDPDALTDGIAYSVFGMTGPHEARVKSIRTANITYIRYFNHVDVLYAADDLHELDDLSDGPTYTDSVVRLQKLLATPGRQACLNSMNDHFRANGYHTASFGKVYHRQGDHSEGWTGPNWRSDKSSRGYVKEKNQNPPPDHGLGNNDCTYSRNGS